jgi:cardiolipin synthase (CMP-forming)
MNVPNLLSVFRLFVTVFFIIAINQGRYTVALCLFVLQGISDLLDGFFARIMGKQTNLGALLDPIADKTMLVSSYVVLYLNGILPLWVAAIVLIRDLTISVGFLLLYKLSYTVKLAPSMWSKITTVSQITTIVYVLWSDLRPYEIYLFYATALLTFVSGCQYVMRGFHIILSKQKV